ncbi:hypothetical protein F4782DRAFT_493673 [Xylaria castorea]|nr:hypothetical protein F4782DRAFT_493673 [Xylaria castorea]
MQFKSLLVIGAIFAPLLAAAPAGEIETTSVDHVARDFEMDPLFKFMAWKEGLDAVLREAVRDGTVNHDSSNSNTKSQNNKAWLAYPPWPNK